jgi:hypothetical protein
MHNPLKLLFKDALDELAKQGHLYYVRQSYTRGKTSQVKEAFLVTPYCDMETAAVHMQAIAHDHRKLIYNIEDPLQKEKLYTAALQPEGYRVYLNRLKDREWKPDAQLVANIKKYIRLYTSWKPGKGSQINAELTLVFGELIINLQHEKDTRQISLNDLEKI